MHGGLPEQFARWPWILSGSPIPDGAFRGFFQIGLSAIASTLTTSQTPLHERRRPTFPTCGEARGVGPLNLKTAHIY